MPSGCNSSDGDGEIERLIALIYNEGTSAGVKHNGAEWKELSAGEHIHRV